MKLTNHQVANIMFAGETVAKDSDTHSPGRLLPRQGITNRECLSRHMTNEAR